jgi:Ca2+-transporting ATPase
MGLAPVIFGWPLLFFPLHVLFLEFVIDPACAFVFEADPESPDTMTRAPRSPDERLFSRETLYRSILLGALVLLTCLIVYWIGLRVVSADEARALAYITLVVANLALIFVSRSHRQSLADLAARPNRIYWWIVAVTLAAMFAVIYIPSFAALFQFTAPSVPLTLAAGTLAALLVLAAGAVLRARS